jgi:hypothetical protein
MDKDFEYLPAGIEPLRPTLASIAETSNVTPKTEAGLSPVDVRCECDLHIELNS